MSSLSEPEAARTRAFDPRVSPVQSSPRAASSRAPLESGNAVSGLYPIASQAAPLLGVERLSIVRAVGLRADAANLADAFAVGFHDWGAGLVTGILIDLIAHRLHKMVCASGLRGAGTSACLSFRIL